MVVVSKTADSRIGDENVTKVELYKQIDSLFDTIPDCFEDLALTKMEIPIINKNQISSKLHLRMIA